MITEERLRQTFSEGGAQEIYQEVKASGDFLGFARQYAFSQDYRVARSALWGLTKARKEELSQLEEKMAVMPSETKRTTWEESDVGSSALKTRNRLIREKRHLESEIEGMFNARK